MFKKIVNPFFLLTLILLICAISKVDAQGGQTVSIPDTKLAISIRIELDLPVDADITAADMLKLTGLLAINIGISDLTGLEHATNLRHLDLSNNRNLFNNQISNLQPLTQLNKLHTLSGVYFYTLTTGDFTATRKLLILK